MFENKIITVGKNSLKVICHIHSKDVIEKGITDKNEYFTSLINKVFIINEKDDILSSLKTKKK